MEQSITCQNEQMQAKNHFHLRYLRGVEAPEHIKRVRLDESAVSADVQLTLMGWISTGKRLMPTDRENQERQVMKEEVRKYHNGKLFLEKKRKENV